MADCMPACIALGGKVPGRVVNQLCTAIQAEGLSLDWGDSPFAPASDVDLLNARQEQNGALVLWLCDDQARWGRFGDLEAFLVKQQIEFDLQADGKYEFDPERVVYRPDLGPLELATDSTGRIVICADPVQAAAEAFSTVLERARSGQLKSFLEQAEAALADLRLALPPPYPQLTTFEIV